MYVSLELPSIRISYMFALIWPLLFVGIAGRSAVSQTTRVEQVTEIAWSREDDKLAIAYDSGTVIIRDLANGVDVLNFQLDTSSIRGLAWSPDGSMLATGSTYPNNALRIVDATTGRQLLERSEFAQDILTVEWQPNGEQIIAVGAEGNSEDGNSLVLNLDTRTEYLSRMGIVLDIKWSSSGDQLAMATLFGIVIRSREDMEPVLSILYDQNKPEPHLRHQFTSIAWSPDATFVASGTSDGSILLWNTNSLIPLYVLDGTLDAETSQLSEIRDIRFDENGETLTSISGDGTLRTWKLQDGTLLSDTRISLNYAAEFSPYGGRLALGLAPEAAGDSGTATDNASRVIHLLGDGEVQIIVPDASLERLNSIANACISAEGQRGLTLASDTTQLSAFVEQLDTLTDEHIPAGCRADLLAVVEAIGGG